MPYVFYRYTQSVRDEFVRVAKQLELFELVTSFCNHFNFPECSIEEAFYTDRAWLFLEPIRPLEATIEDYAQLVISAAAAFPLFDVFTRLCSEPKLAIPQNYCPSFYCWYENTETDNIENYISQFLIEPISNESVWKSEAETRRIFEELFNAKFPKSHPNWLKSHKGTSLELDGYNQDLKIAFEYQGEYHYMDVPIHQQGRTLAEIQQTDKLKRDLCQRQGVTLIQVPYWEKGRKQFILESLQAVGKLSA